jgi:hypothetical protein
MDNGIIRPAGLQHPQSNAAAMPAVPEQPA